SRRYDQPNLRETRDTVILDSTEIRHVARLNLDGSLDKTFRFSGNTAFSGGNGNIATMLHEEGPHKGKIFVYGECTSCNGQAICYDTRINSDGTIDPTFNPGGLGTDHYNQRMTYNPVTNKYVAVGSFKTYKGRPALRMALL